MEPEPKNLVSQVVPKTLAGLAVWILIFASGMAASGVAFFAYYRYQLDSVKGEMDRFREDFDEEFKGKTKEFTELVDESRAEIKRLAGTSGARTEELTALLERISPSIAHVQGLGAEGNPSSGSGFVVASDPNETWVLTNFHLVAGSAAAKSPARLRLGDAQRDGAVHSWDEARDLALLIVKMGGTPALEWAESQPALGVKLWAAGAGPGRFGATATQGLLIDASAEGLLTDADVPALLTGGALLDTELKVLGVLSIRYAPEGFAPSNGWAVPIHLSCRRVLRCPG